MSKLLFAIHVYENKDGKYLLFREDMNGHMAGGFADKETTEQIEGWLSGTMQEVQKN